MEKWLITWVVYMFLMSIVSYILHQDIYLTSVVLMITGMFFILFYLIEKFDKRLQEENNGN